MAARERGAEWFLATDAERNASTGSTANPLRRAVRFAAGPIAMDLDVFADTSVYHLTSDGGLPYPPFQSIDAYALTVYTSRRRHVPVTPVRRSEVPPAHTESPPPLGLTPILRAFRPYECYGYIHHRIPSCAHRGTTTRAACTLIDDAVLQVRHDARPLQVYVEARERYL